MDYVEPQWAAQVRSEATGRAFLRSGSAFRSSQEPRPDGSSRVPLAAAFMGMLHALSFLCFQMQLQIAP